MGESVRENEERRQEMWFTITSEEFYEYFDPEVTTQK